MKTESLAGKIFGRLTAEKRDKLPGDTTGYWICKCTCGNNIRVSTGNLKNGKTQSCGCYRKEISRSQRINLSGRRFGDLIVKNLSNVYSDNEGNFRSEWNCVCDCGRDIVIKGKNLTRKTRGKTHCGCKAKAKDEVFVKIFYNQYISNAKKRKIRFNLTIEEFKEIINQPCYYCGNKQNIRYRKINEKIFKFSYMGIDRKNNLEKRYDVDACVPCCTKCNNAKAELDYKDFLTLINNIYTTLILGQQKENWAVQPNFKANNIYKAYKKAGKKRGGELLIERETFFRLIQLNCFYCGKTPDRATDSKEEPCFYNGLDRVDNNNNFYSEENVVPCCKDCNFAKGCMSIEDFKKWIIQVYNFNRNTLLSSLRAAQPQRITLETLFTQ